MSSRKKRDYKHVLQSIVDLADTVAVERVTVDYEHAIWRTIPKVFPTVTIHGCGFHWAQAVWRQVQAHGLQVAYRQDCGTHRFIRKLLALPYLPCEDVTTAFDELISSTALTPNLITLVAYIRNQWITSTIFPPPSWSVYKGNVRTNNDVEGWHNRLNSHAGKSQLPFYVLTTLLKEEAEDIDMTLKLVSDRKIKRIQSKSYRTLQGRLHNCWDRYANGDLSPMQLLAECSYFVPF